MPSTLHTCRPIRSTSCGGIDDDGPRRRAPASTSSYTRSRAAGVSSLESASPGTWPRRPVGQHDRGHDERPGAGAAAGLVGTGDRREAGALERLLVGVEAALAAYDEPRHRSHMRAPRAHRREPYDGRTGVSAPDCVRARAGRRWRGGAAAGRGPAARRSRRRGRSRRRRARSPCPGCCWWARLSSETDRWSPITQSSSFGHGDRERLAGRLVAGVEVRLVQRHAVDGDAAAGRRSTRPCRRRRR